MRAMMVMRRSCGYPELLESLKGKRVLVWTCNTCARLCNGIGGAESAGRLADRMAEDGVDVVGTLSVGASCMESKIVPHAESLEEGADVILALTCDVGSELASEVFGLEAVNPVDTVGPGYLDRNGVPVLRDGSVVMMGADPFV